MTVVTIRNGIMAVDSELCVNNVAVGFVKKWRKVRKKYGGGFVAASGDFDCGVAAMGKFCDTGRVPSGDADYALSHLRADGSYWESRRGHDFNQYDAPFHSVGGGSEIALGAMAHGATAQQAVEIACDMVHGCGGTVHVLSVTA